MREGRPLLVDDATLIPPRVLAVLYPAMDGRGVITIPGYRNERVEAVPPLQHAALRQHLTNLNTLIAEITDPAPDQDGGPA
jgi:hypothetical protein